LRHQLRLLVFTLLVVGLDLSGFAAFGDSDFPGVFWPGEQRLSASGNLIAVSVFSHGDKAPTLYVRDRRTDHVLLRYPYTRGLGILWSTHTQRLVIDDHYASDYANCIVYDFDRSPAIRFDIRAELQRRIADHREIFVNDHVYIDCAAWTSDDRVRVAVHGYGNNWPNASGPPREREIRLDAIYTLGHGFSSIR
jgi:hypothetical protein